MSFAASTVPALAAASALVSLGRRRASIVPRAEPSEKNIEVTYDWATLFGDRWVCRMDAVSDDALKNFESCIAVLDPSYKHFTPITPDPLLYSIHAFFDVTRAIAGSFQCFKRSS